MQCKVKELGDKHCDVFVQDYLEALLDFVQKVRRYKYFSYKTRRLFEGHNELVVLSVSPKISCHKTRKSELGILTFSDIVKPYFVKHVSIRFQNALVILSSSQAASSGCSEYHSNIQIQNKNIICYRWIYLVVKSGNSVCLTFTISQQHNQYCIISQIFFIFDIWH